MKYLLILFPLIVFGASAEDDLNPGHPNPLQTINHTIQIQDTDPSDAPISLGAKMFPEITCQTVLKTFAIGAMYIILDRLYLSI